MLHRIKNFFFDLKMKHQRAKKGYCDRDVWNVCTFIEETLLNILIEFRTTHMSYPMECKTVEEWDKIIDRMIFLLGEMDEDKCSFKTDHLEDKIYYQRQCKDEFYELLKKWHWNLWS